MTERATPDNAGCWIDGHWGQYGCARLVELADSYGYPGKADIADASDILASMGPSDHEADPEAWEHIHDAADSAEEWLNDNIAPEGYSFGWYDGEFFLWSQASWDDEGQYGL